MVTVGLVLMACNYPNDSDNWFGGLVVLAILFGVQVFIEKRFMDESPELGESEPSNTPQQDSGGDS